jgi:hypothetical protein
MSTVLGVPLNEGERVYYAEEENLKTARIIQGVVAGFMLLLGLATLIAIVGVVFIGIGGWMLYKVLKPDPDAVAGLVLTDQRFMAVPDGAEGRLVQIPTTEIEDADVERAKARSSGGGLVGALASAAANAYLDHKANKAGKLKPDYWDRCTAIKVQMKGGLEQKIPVPDKNWGKTVGPMLITGLEHGWESMNEIQAPAQRQHAA